MSETQAPGAQPRIMGILNATPDSFSDGGAHAGALAERVRQMVAEGAEIVDIGGESTRPGADVVPVEEEWRRVAPALEAAAGTGALVSIDTRKAEIARRAFDAGARLFNDVSALGYDPGSMAMAAQYAEAGGSVCLMHALGDPKTMQDAPSYVNVVEEVYAFLRNRIDACLKAGIARSALIVDPGIGFGKTLDHNITLMRGLSRFHDLGCAVMLGASRKRFIGTLSDEPEAGRRAAGSVAAALYGAMQGADILRVHDVRETVQALKVWRALAIDKPAPSGHQADS